MYHQQVSWWRRRRVTEQLEPESLDWADADPTDATALRLSLAAMLRRLTPRQRAVVVLRFYDDLSEAQAAEVLGCTVGTVKRHCHDAVQRLRAIAPELVDAAPARTAQ
jgi:RNA polymerase sigma factor (sigma-70 family)